MTASRRRSAGRPTRHEAAAIDDALLDEARRMFSAKGLSGASIEGIAQATGITKHTIYRRYPGKKELLDAVVMRDLQRVARHMETVPEGQEPLAALHAAGFKLFSYVTDPEQSRFLAFLEAECMRCPDMHDKFIEWNDLAHKPFVSLIEQAQRDGQLVPADSHYLSALLMDLIRGAAVRHDVLGTDREGTEQDLEARLRFFIAGASVATAGQSSGDGRAHHQLHLVKKQYRKQD